MNNPDRQSSMMMPVRTIRKDICPKCKSYTKEKKIGAATKYFCPKCKVWS